MRVHGVRTACAVPVHMRLPLALVPPLTRTPPLPCAPKVRGYLYDSWNLLDGSIVIISLISLLDSIDSLNFLRALRVLRALRPLRLLHRFPGMQVVVISLMKAGPAIVNVMVVLLLFWLIFGILGVQIFKGTFYQASRSMP